MRVRAGLVTSIYNKALLLSSHERAERASGDIVNLMSVDATRLQDFCAYGLIAISGPLQVKNKLPCKVYSSFSQLLLLDCACVRFSVQRM
jgi:hypothetical protein